MHETWSWETGVIPWEVVESVGLEVQIPGGGGPCGATLGTRNISTSPGTSIFFWDGEGLVR